MNVTNVEILGIPFAKLTWRQAVEKLLQFLDEPKNHIIVTPNPEGVMQARRNPAFSEALRGADLSLADGTGILLASRYLRRGLPERVRGVDTAFVLFEELQKRDFSVFLLGGADGVAEKAKANLEKKYPRVKVAGFHHGFFSEREEIEILSEINRLSPDILLVCTGMPRAEIWATAHRNINVRLTMCLGGTIDIMAKTAKLAPSWLRRLGLEWLYRLIRQPRRFLRMLDIPRFVWAVLWCRNRA